MAGRYRGGCATAAFGAAGFGAGATNGVTLGYWNVWAGCMSISFYA
jgi:hypothetical protein